jgi:thiamine-phosphate pyrophosphorylase
VTPRLCYISDGERGTGGRPLVDVITSAAAGGVDAVVLRERLSGAAWTDLLAALAPLRARGLAVLTSRRLDLVRAFGLEGVHLAADAIRVREARAWLGPAATIGYSAHSGAEARRAAEDGASYVTLSPIYPTESKPGAPGRGCRWLARAVRDLPIPALALGGVTAERTPEVLAAGAAGVAVVSAIGAAGDVAAAAGGFREVMQEDSE